MQFTCINKQIPKCGEMIDNLLFMTYHSMMLYFLYLEILKLTCYPVFLYSLCGLKWFKKKSNTVFNNMTKFV